MNSRLNGIGYKIVTGRDKQTLQFDKGLYVLAEPSGGIIRIIPEIQGAKSGVLSFILGGTLLAGAFLLGQPELGPTAYSMMLGTGVSLAAGGLVNMISPQTKTKSSASSSSNPSYIFSGAVNTTIQGVPVPLLYGRMIVGSAVISAGTDAEDYSSQATNVGSTMETESSSSTVSEG